MRTRGINQQDDCSTNFGASAPAAPPPDVASPALCGDTLVHILGFMDLLHHSESTAMVGHKWYAATGQAASVKLRRAVAKAESGAVVHTRQHPGNRDKVIAQDEIFGALDVSGASRFSMEMLSVGSPQLWLCARRPGGGTFIPCPDNPFAFLRSENNQSVVFMTDASNRNPIWARRQGDAVHMDRLHSSNYFSHLALSPDGQYVAFVENSAQ